MSETVEYRLTRGKHWEGDPDRPGKLRRRVAGEVVSLTKNQAQHMADRIEPLAEAKRRVTEMRAETKQKNAGKKKKAGKKKAR